MQVMMVMQAPGIAISANHNRKRRMKRTNKKGQIFRSGPRILVRLAGIEPTTPWFVAKYSIQLSYSRFLLLAHLQRYY